MTRPIAQGCLTEWQYVLCASGAKAYKGDEDTQEHAREVFDLDFKLDYVMEAWIDGDSSPHIQAFYDIQDMVNSYYDESKRYLLTLDEFQLDIFIYGGSETEPYLTNKFERFECKMWIDTAQTIQAWRKHGRLTGYDKRLHAIIKKHESVTINS